MIQTFCVFAVKIKCVKCVIVIDTVTVIVTVTIITIIIIIIIIIMFSRNVCLESLGPRPNHGPEALKGSQFLA